VSQLMMIEHLNSRPSFSVWGDFYRPVLKEFGRPNHAKLGDETGQSIASAPNCSIDVLDFRYMLLHFETRASQMWPGGGVERYGVTAI